MPLTTPTRRQVHVSSRAGFMGMSACGAATKPRVSPLSRLPSIPAYIDTGDFYGMGNRNAAGPRAGRPPPAGPALRQVRRRTRANGAFIGTIRARQPSPASSPIACSVPHRLYRYPPPVAPRPRVPIEETIGAIAIDPGRICALRGTVRSRRDYCAPCPRRPSYLRSADRVFAGEPRD